MTAVDGVVYRGDRLGVIKRRRRRLGAAAMDPARRRGHFHEPPTSPAPWQTAAPVADGASILLIAPDIKPNLRLDRQTGAILGQSYLGDFDPVKPRYLVRIGDMLGCVGEDRVAFLHAAAATATPEPEKPASTPAVITPGIRGRCVVSGDKLIMPTVTGYTIADPAKPEEPVNVALEETGNILPLDSQLIVVDDSRVHSYLRWEVAEGLLTKRIQENPKDPSPAVTYAELAYRAGRPDKIVAAVRMAMSALKDGPQNDTTWNARARLIDAMQSMLATALEPAPAGAPASGAAAPPAPPSTKGPPSAQPITDRATLEQLVTMLGELSFQPEDKLAYTLALGRLSELNSKPEDAAEAYQKVLADNTLAGAIWHGPQVSIRGELEAARRLESLLKQHGAQVYAAQERQAQADLDALGATPTEPQLEALAAKYPLAKQTPEIWERIADLRTQDKKPQQAAAALEAGLRAATRQPDAPPAVVGEIAGRLIVGLRERQQLTAAAGVLRTVRARFPGLPLTAAGQPLDSEKLVAELASKIAASLRWPHVGPVRADGAQAIAGWSIMEPLLSDRSPTVTTLLPLNSDDEIGVWTVPITDKSDAHELLVKAWSQSIPENAHPYLLRTTADAA